MGKFGEMTNDRDRESNRIYAMSREPGRTNQTRRWSSGPFDCFDDPEGR